MHYTVKGTATATGVSESRLRTWERRYGVPAPERTDSGQRRYSDGDIAVVRRMAALILSGVSASNAADAVRMEGTSEAELHEASSRPHPLVELFVQKTLAFDQGWLLRILRDSVYSTGWAPTMERIAFPALEQLSAGWGEASMSAVNIAFAAEVIRCEVGAQLAQLNGHGGHQPQVLLGCPEGESHDLGLLALSVMLRQRDLGVLYLGPDVRPEDLVTAVRQAKPSAVCLHVATRAQLAGLNRAARTLVVSRVPAQLFLYAPSLAPKDMPTIPGVQLPAGLAAATERIAGALRSSGNGGNGRNGVDGGSTAKGKGAAGN